MDGVRVTDAVIYYGRRGEARGAVRQVRFRPPDRLRWRSAVGLLTRSAGKLRGLDRMRIEEPVREVVVSLSQAALQREVVLDARRYNVDLDRGELLPEHRMGDLRRMAYLVGTDVQLISRYVRLPDDFEAPIDTAGVAVVARAYAAMHRRRSHRLFLELPDQDGPGLFMQHHTYMKQRADRDADRARRWTALARALLGQPGEA